MQAATTTKDSDKDEGNEKNSTKYVVDREENLQRTPADYLV